MVKKEPLCRDAIQRAKSKIEMGLKRKKELEVEILPLTNKRKKLSAKKKGSVLINEENILFVWALFYLAFLIFKVL